MKNIHVLKNDVRRLGEFLKDKNNNMSTLDATMYKQPKQILDNISFTNNYGEDKEQINFKIRKLTPKECWRLMGFTDKQFSRAKESGISDSQLYKQAGNSIVVNCLYYIFKELFKNYIVK